MLHLEYALVVARPRHTRARIADTGDPSRRATPAAGNVTRRPSASNPGRKTNAPGPGRSRAPGAPTQHRERITHHGYRSQGLFGLARPAEAPTARCRTWRNPLLRAALPATHHTACPSPRRSTSPWAATVPSVTPTSVWQDPTCTNDDGGRCAPPQAHTGRRRIGTGLDRPARPPWTNRPRQPPRGADTRRSGQCLPAAAQAHLPWDRRASAGPRVRPSVGTYRPSPRR